MNRINTRRLVETALLLAIAVVLSLIQPFRLPFGGGITIVSMLPIVLISYRHGVRWGLFSAFVYAVIQIFTDFSSTIRAFFLPDSGLTLPTALLIILLDYLVAFTLLGLGGIFRDRMKASTALCLGSVVALSLRFAAHILSGSLFFGAWAEWFFTQDSIAAWGANVLSSMSGTTLAVFYSICYNATFMIPEIILTAVFAFILGKIPVIAEKLH